VGQSRERGSRNQLVARVKLATARGADSEVQPPLSGASHFLQPVVAPPDPLEIICQE
jgi:hypothetical protein